MFFIISLYIISLQDTCMKHLYFLFSGVSVHILCSFFYWIIVFSYFWLCGKYLKRWEYQTTLPASWETCMQVKKQQLELGMEQWTGSKLGKVYVKAVY